jgi:hypothetical protein
MFTRPHIGHIVFRLCSSNDAGTIVEAFNWHVEDWFLKDLGSGFKVLIPCDCHSSRNADATFIPDRRHSEEVKQLLFRFLVPV